MNGSKNGSPRLESFYVYVCHDFNMLCVSHQAERHVVNQAFRNFTGLWQGAEGLADALPVLIIEFQVNCGGF